MSISSRTARRPREVLSPRPRFRHGPFARAGVKAAQHRHVRTTEDMPRLHAAAVAIALLPACRAPMALGGGLHVARNAGCEHGCDAIRDGHRIHSVDGELVDGAALDAIADGKLHRVGFTSPFSSELETTRIRIRSGASPFVVVPLAALNETPAWARKPMFAHWLPDDARGRCDRPRLTVYWDRGEPVAAARASIFVRVLHKARADLVAAGVEIILVDSRVPEDEPAIVVRDRDCVVRWHSEGISEPPVHHPLRSAEQYSIISAVVFALALANGHPSE